MLNNDYIFPTFIENSGDDIALLYSVVTQWQ